MFILYDKEMNKIDLPKGVTPLDIFISSISKERVTESIEGRDGNIDYGSTYTSRDIELKLLLKANDTQDYRLLRDAVYETFQKEDSFFVSETYEKGKRYLISVDEQFIPERIQNNQRYAEATINCTKLGLPFAESIGTTLDIEGNGISANDELWGFGMGLQSVDETLKYIHDTRTFRVYNAGNTAIHPFQQDLLIMLNGVFNEGYELKNRTTGDTFRVVKDMHGTIVLDGAEVANNGLQALRNTNRQFISLAPGWNDFEQSSNNYLVFSFRFYYL